MMLSGTWPAYRKNGGTYGGLKVQHQIWPFSSSASGWRHMSHSLNSLKGGYIGDYIGSYYRVIKGDTRNLDYSSYMVGYQDHGPLSGPTLERPNLGHTSPKP